MLTSNLLPDSLRRHRGGSLIDIVKDILGGINNNGVDDGTSSGGGDTGSNTGGGPFAGLKCVNFDVLQSQVVTPFTEE